MREKKRSRDGAVTAYRPFQESDRLTIDEKNRFKRSDATIIRALKLSRGYKNIAAFLLRMRVDSLSVRLARSPHLQEARDSIVDDFLHMSESVVFNAIKGGDAGLAFKVLASLGREHGWSPELEDLKKSVAGPELNINISVDPDAGDGDYEQVEHRVTKRRRIKLTGTMPAGVVRTRVKKVGDNRRKLIIKSENGQPAVESKSVEQQIAELKKLQQDGYNRSVASF